MKEIENSDSIALHYTGTLSNGEVFDSSEGRDPLKFEVGAGHVIPGFDKAVLGMKVNENKKFTIPADEAYGHKNDEMIITMPVSAIPAELNVHVGQKLLSSSPDGQQIPVTVTAVTEETVTLDANHPLAGEDLTFDISIVSIN